ncbi:MAG TPA: hypothetical protein EYO59_11830 [Chromatiaceae bacterium]|nr:hypothetical protein [Chromatiaceae bacterium]
MTTITANVHNIDTETQSCVITIKDGDELVLERKNIGLELNPDGTANTAWIKDKISSRISSHRRDKVRKKNASISVGGIGEQKQ